jgi:hypothetical protein
MEEKNNHESKTGHLLAFVTRKRRRRRKNVKKFEVSTPGDEAAAM